MKNHLLRLLSLLFFFSHPSGALALSGVESLICHGKIESFVFTPPKSPTALDEYLATKIALIDTIEERLLTAKGKEKTGLELAYKLHRNLLYTALLGRAPTRTETEALEAIHEIGDGELGANGRDAERDNYTYNQIKRKVKALAALRLHPDKEEDWAIKKKLLTSGTVGTKKSKFKPTPKNELLARVMENTLQREMSPTGMVLASDVGQFLPAIEVYPGKTEADFHASEYKTITEVQAEHKEKYSKSPSGSEIAKGLVKAVFESDEAFEKRLADAEALRKKDFEETHARHQSIQDTWDFMLSMTEADQVSKLTGSLVQDYAKKFVDLIVAKDGTAEQNKKAWAGFFKVINGMSLLRPDAHEKVLAAIFSLLMKQDYYGLGVTRQDVLALMKQGLRGSDSMKSHYATSLRSLYSGASYETLAGGPGTKAATVELRGQSYPLALLSQEIFDSVSPTARLTNSKGEVKARKDILPNEMYKTDGFMDWGFRSQKPAEKPSAVAQTKPALPAPTPAPVVPVVAPAGEKPVAQGTELRVGQSVYAKFGTKWYSATVLALQENGHLTLRYPNGDVEVDQRRDRIAVRTGSRDGLSVGDRVLAKYNAKWYYATVLGMQENGSFIVKYPDDSLEEQTRETISVRTGTAGGIEVQQKVLAKYKGKWYDATVVGLNRDGSYITKYPDNSLEEQTRESLCLKAGTSCEISVNQKVVAKYRNKWYDATVVGIQSNGDFVARYPDGSLEEQTKDSLGVKTGEAGGIQVGNKILAKYGGKWYEATVAAIHDNGNLVARYPNDSLEEQLEQTIALRSGDRDGVTVNQRVFAKFGDKWYEASVAGFKKDGTVLARYPDGSFEEQAPGTIALREGSSDGLAVNQKVLASKDSTWYEATVVGLQKNGRYVLSFPSGNVYADRTWDTILTVTGIRDGISVGQTVYGKVNGKVFPAKVIGFEKDGTFALSYEDGTIAKKVPRSDLSLEAPLTFEQSVQRALATPEGQKIIQGDFSVGKKAYSENGTLRTVVAVSTSGLVRVKNGIIGQFTLNGSELVHSSSLFSLEGMDVKHGIAVGDRVITGSGEEFTVMGMRADGSFLLKGKTKLKLNKWVVESGANLKRP